MVRGMQDWVECRNESAGPFILLVPDGIADLRRISF